MVTTPRCNNILCIQIETSSEEEEEFDFVEEVRNAAAEDNPKAAKTPEESSPKLSVLECARRNKSKEETAVKQREQQQKGPFT